MENPLIFDIARASLIDGPGIRTTVFFKGCPLRCVWCHNPESYTNCAELKWEKAKCIFCGQCTQTCKHHSILNRENHIIDTLRCLCCGNCVNACASNALSLIGKFYPPKQLVEILLRDAEYYITSGGGITFSGGEPLTYLNYLEEVCKELKNHNEEISIAVQTCGYFNYKMFKKTLEPYINLIYYDLKILERQRHYNYTSQFNDLILENLKKLSQSNNCNKRNIKIIIRTPLIPLITDTKKNISDIKSFVKSLKIDSYDFLPYNPVNH